MENDIYNYLQKIPGSTLNLVAELQRWIRFEFWFGGIRVQFKVKAMIFCSVWKAKIQFTRNSELNLEWQKQAQEIAQDSFVAKVIKARKSPSSIMATTIVNTKWINQVLADKPKLQLQWWWFFNDPHSLLPRDKWEKWFVLQLHYY